MREKLIDILSNYFRIGNSYHFMLERIKEAFGMGTMSLDDFREYDEDDVAEIVEHLIQNGATIPVRCQDCKHYFEGEPYDPCECMKWKTRYGVTYTTPDGYCHKGERKTDG